MLHLCEPLGCAGSFAWSKALTRWDRGVSPGWGNSVVVAQAAARASEDPVMGFQVMHETRERTAQMKATIYTAVIGLVALFAGFAPAGHMMHSGV